MSVVEEHVTEKLAIFKHIQIIFNGVKVVLIFFLHPVHELCQKLGEMK